MIVKEFPRFLPFADDGDMDGALLAMMVVMRRTLSG